MYEDNNDNERQFTYSSQLRRMIVFNASSPMYYFPKHSLPLSPHCRRKFYSAINVPAVFVRFQCEKNSQMPAGESNHHVVAVYVKRRLHVCIAPSSCCTHFQLRYTQLNCPNNKKWTYDQRQKRPFNTKTVGCDTAP